MCLKVQWESGTHHKRYLDVSPKAQKKMYTKKHSVKYCTISCACGLIVNHLDGLFSISIVFRQSTVIMAKLDST